MSVGPSRGSSAYGIMQQDIYLSQLVGHGIDIRCLSPPTTRYIFIVQHLPKMSFNSELTSFYDNFRKAAPDAYNALGTAATDFSASFDGGKAAAVGDQFPGFRLLGVNGELVKSDDLLRHGPLLVIFYRGGWCPVCNMHLRSWQRHSQKLRDAGATLVTISPDPTEETRSRGSSMEIDLPMLSDPDNTLARKLKVIFQQPENIRPIIESTGFPVGRSMEVPIPATLLVDQAGTIRRAFIDPDFRRRLEPMTALKWIKEMNQAEEQQSVKTGGWHQDLGAHWQTSGCRFGPWAV